MTIFVTGAAGFIGSNFVLKWLESSDENLIALDKLTYAGNLENLKSIENNPCFHFIKGDIENSQLLGDILKKFKPRSIINFAAETHVDRSIDNADIFIQTNILGTYRLLQEAKNFWTQLSNDLKNNFTFIHISTDEVFGTLNLNDPAFKETNNYEPNSPYSASKAASDHLVRAWFQTFKLPVITTNCSNNYGPYHFPEKLIPLSILNALEGKDIPVYGDGRHIRDWLYVEDHCHAINMILKKGLAGETYNIGGYNEKTNLEVVNTICEILDKLKPRLDKKSYKTQISFVKDRPGHDFRYAIDSSKISDNLGWKPKETFESGILKTIKWFLKNQDWVKRVKSGEYQKWVSKHYK